MRMPDQAESIRHTGAPRKDDPVRAESRSNRNESHQGAKDAIKAILFAWSWRFKILTSRRCFQAARRKIDADDCIFIFALTRWQINSFRIMLVLGKMGHLIKIAAGRFLACAISGTSR